MSRSEPRILRQKKLLAVTGLSRSTIWHRIRSGDFPRPVKLSVRAVGWRKSEGRCVAKFTSDGMKLTRDAASSTLRRATTSDL